MCLVDETGTACMDDFALGLVFTYANSAAKFDKEFSDLLPAGSGEFHANKWDDSGVLSVLTSFADKVEKFPFEMYNFQRSYRHITCPQTYYATALVEAVKACGKDFRRQHVGADIINNIHIMVDANSQNTGEIFASHIAKHKKDDGIFRGVSSVTPLDSSVSRLLQVADGVAYSRKFILNKTIRSETLKKEYGIKLL